MGWFLLGSKANAQVKAAKITADHVVGYALRRLKLRRMGIEEDERKARPRWMQEKDGTVRRMRARKDEFEEDGEQCGTVVGGMGFES